MRLVFKSAHSFNLLQHVAIEALRVPCPWERLINILPQPQTPKSLKSIFVSDKIN